ncbi:MAG TPA: heme lyase CcmF/NrfE family subunit [Gammaproteobacteria bacterium]|nr:heme lyase CcmF/NrfE family subunit [Gammaproteobacteria bacterium]
MLPELGHFALILGLCLALAQAALALAGAHTGRPEWMAVARPAATGQFVFVIIAFAALAYAFMVNDFSVLYVASNSNSELPAAYRFAAVWGAHEGSLLLWIAVLSGWTLAVAVMSRNLPETFAARVLGVLGLISAGFMLFTLLTSNPFERLIPAAADGRDLNPVLQDPALVMHPPMLYTGYVGFSVAFAFAVAAMLEGRLDAAWARWTRPWTTAAWIFLTVGIALGSWWAYYELGWGGWWFWDPVENASFMPWLVGTALIHSLAVTESRGLFKSWTLLLAIAAFSLSLLGTFLVRSGVLVSVHAFATDPTRGFAILLFLALVIGGALVLYAWRAPQLRSDAGFRPLSRETFLLANNVLLVIAAGLILLGTLYPLFLDALGLGKISVGPPYFATVFLIPALPLVLLLGVGMHAGWKRAHGANLADRLKAPFLLALAAAVLVPLAIYGSAPVLTVVGVLAAFWVMLSALAVPLARLRGGRRPLPRRLLGMSVAHFGVGVFVLGVTVTSAFSVEMDRGVRPGESLNVAGFDFEFRGTRDVDGPNYSAIEAEVAVSREGQPVATLRPQKRVYRVQTSPMTEAGIDAGWARDLYVALGDPLGDGGWSIRLQYKPLVRFIWLGALLMAFGGLLAVTDRRYRLPAAAARAEEAATRGGSGPFVPAVGENPR